MALLCSDSRINTFDMFEANPAYFDVRKAPDIAGRKKNRQILNINEEGWERFLHLKKHFDECSHASAFALSCMLMLQEPGKMAIGGEFDPGKIVSYRKEIGWRIGACKELIETVRVVERHLTLNKQRHERQILCLRSQL